MLLADVAYCPAGAVSALAGFAAHVRETLGDTPELRVAFEQLEHSLGVGYMRLPGRPRLPLPAPQAEEPLAATLGAFVLQAFSAAALNPALPVLCEKTPSNALYFPRLCRILPEARIVVMVRDPVAVALSHTQRDWGPTDPLEAASYTAAYFRRWRLMAIEDERCLVVRHETLSPSLHVFSRLCSIISGCAAWVRYCETHVGSSGQAWIAAKGCCRPSSRRCARG